MFHRCLLFFKGAPAGKEYLVLCRRVFVQRPVGIILTFFSLVSLWIYPVNVQMKKMKKNIQNGRNTYFLRVLDLLVNHTCSV